MKYFYVYTADKNKEERINRINKALEYVKENNLDVVFCVNDLQSISYIKENGYKALNVDALEDLLNLSDGSDEFYLLTPEDTTFIKVSFANVKEL